MCSQDSEGIWLIEFVDKQYAADFLQKQSQQAIIKALNGVKPQLAAELLCSLKFEESSEAKHTLEDFSKGYNIFFLCQSLTHKEEVKRCLLDLQNNLKFDKYHAEFMEHLSSNVTETDPDKESLLITKFVELHGNNKVGPVRYIQVLKNNALTHVKEQDLKKVLDAIESKDIASLKYPDVPEICYLPYLSLAALNMRTEPLARCVLEGMPPVMAATLLFQRLNWGNGKGEDVGDDKLKSAFEEISKLITPANTNQVKDIIKVFSWLAPDKMKLTAAVFNVLQDGDVLNILDKLEPEATAKLLLSIDPADSMWICENLSTRKEVREALKNNARALSGELFCHELGSTDELTLLCFSQHKVYDQKLGIIYPLLLHKEDRCLKESEQHVNNFEELQKLKQLKVSNGISRYTLPLVNAIVKQNTLFDRREEHTTQTLFGKHEKVATSTLFNQLTPLMAALILYDMEDAQIISFCKLNQIKGTLFSKANAKRSIDLVCWLRNLAVPDEALKASVQDMNSVRKSLTRIRRSMTRTKK